MAAIEALLALRVRAVAVGLPYTAAPRNRPVQALGRPGLTERGVRSVLLAVGKQTVTVVGGPGLTTGEGPNGGSESAGSMTVTSVGNAGRSDAL